MPDGYPLARPRDIKRWVAQLPTAHVGETARQVYKALVAFNRVEIDVLKRAEGIELFREPVRYINANLTRHYVEVGFPLNSKAKRAAELAIEMAYEVCNSYKIIILHLLNADEKHFDQNLLIVSIHRALQYMEQALFHSYLAYMNFRPGLWREMHSLYAYAEQNQVHEVPVKDSSKLFWRKHARSIKELYTGFLILSTTSPYGLRQSQVRRIHDNLPEWSKLAKISGVEEVRYDAGVYFVNLWSDNPPQRNIADSDRKDSRFRALDLNELLNLVRQDYEDAPWDSPVEQVDDKEHLSRSLLRLLIRSWNKSLDRKFARTQLSVELEVVAGLTNIFRVLEEDQAPKKPEEPKPAEPKSRHGAGALQWNDSVFSTLAIASPVNTATGDSIFPDSLAAASTILEENNQAVWSQAQPPKTDQLFSVLTYNENAEGYCFNLTGKHSPKVKVGELLGVKSQTTARQYSLGIIRWLRHGEKDELFMGLQVISSQCSAVIVFSGNSPSAARRNQQNCLLLTGDGVDQNQLGLVVNTRKLRMDEPLTLVTEFGRHLIKLTQIVESSSSFIHYQFSYIKEREAPDRDSRSDSDFSEIWDDL
ncbi:MAG: hypothetical protein ACWA5Q_02670 [bacterium]